MTRWCEWQEEDAEGVYCTAHLHEDRVIQCSYKDNVERKSKKYPCQDYRAVDGGQNECQ